jgi:hypothetical protein
VFLCLFGFGVPVIWFIHFRERCISLYLRGEISGVRQYERFVQLGGFHTHRFLVSSCLYNGRRRITWVVRRNGVLVRARVSLLLHKMQLCSTTYRSYLRVSFQAKWSLELH